VGSGQRMGFSFPFVLALSPPRLFLISAMIFSASTCEVQNWDLAKYAARDFPNIPAANMTIMTEPVQEIREAIEAKSGTKFGKAFEKVTSACAWSVFSFRFCGVRFSGG
jgi:hypothetical protein